MRCVLLDGIVNPVIVVVGYTITNQPPEVFFMERDDIVQDLPIRAGLRKRFAQLLDHPFGTRMRGDVEMQNAAARVRSRSSHSRV
jgi:hypothetical protein